MEGPNSLAEPRRKIHISLIPTEKIVYHALGGLPVPGQPRICRKPITLYFQGVNPIEEISLPLG
jgi:hypothetical protein